MDRKCSKQKKRLIVALSIGVGIWGWGGLLPAVQAASTVVAESKEGALLVVGITVQGCDKMTKEQVLRLVPELKANQVNIKRLSKQIQLVNDTMAVKLETEFKANPGGGFDVLLKVEELQETYDVLSINNTGNAYTGDYRMTNTYMNTNLTNRADAFGFSVVTSPGHWGDVRQAGLLYRQILPEAGDSFYLNYSYSDVQMGQIANFGGFSMEAAGKGQAVGLHYQKNLTYKPNRREYLDFGVDYRRYDNSNILNIYNIGQPISAMELGVDVNVVTVGISYMNHKRSASASTSYSIGYVVNIGGDRDKYNAYRTGSDESFGIVKAGLMQQYKFSSEWLANIKISAQYTKDNLITTEQLGVGGMYSVRGFDERTIGADNGYIANIEFYSPEIAKGQRLLLFTDIAHLLNNSTNPGELKNDTIASVGVGYRYTDENGWSASLDYGYVIDDIEGRSDQDHGKIHMIVSKKL